MKRTKHIFAMLLMLALIINVTACKSKSEVPDLTLNDTSDQAQTEEPQSSEDETEETPSSEQDGENTPETPSSAKDTKQPSTNTSKPSESVTSNTPPSTTTPSGTNTPSSTTTPSGTNTPPSTNTPSGTNTPSSSGSNNSSNNTTPTPSNPPVSGTTSGSSQIYQQVLQLVNQERTARGLNALSYRSDLQTAANIRAEEIIDSFSHTRPNGTPCFTVFEEIKASYRRAGENIAYGYSTPSAVMTGWMNSQGHRENILNSAFTGIVVGYVQHNGTCYWVQLFVA